MKGKRMPYLSQKAVVYHETGHLVIGIRQGLDPWEILFDSPTCALTAFKPCDPIPPPEEEAMRQLAGIITQLEFVPESISSQLREAMRESVIFGYGRPLPVGLSSIDLRYRGGGGGDMDKADQIARSIPGLDDCGVMAFLQQAEVKVRTLLSDPVVRRHIETIAQDIEVWLQKDFSPSKNRYHGERALSVIGLARDSEREAGDSGSAS